MFKERKVAQMAAFFLLQEEGGIMYVLKLMKLLYLAERETLFRYGIPMCGDRAFSMDHGPVLSTTLDLMNGFVRVEDKNGWDGWISDRSGHRVTLKKEVKPEALDELSPANIETLQSVWDKFGGFDQWELVAYTHDNCSEWQNPHASSIPITYEEIFLALGYSEDETHQLIECIEDEGAIDRLLQAG